MEKTYLEISVHVDLHNAVLDGLLVLLKAAAGATVEHKEDGLLVLAAELLANEGLVLAQKLRVKLDVSGCVLGTC